MIDNADKLKDREIQEEVFSLTIDLIQFPLRSAKNILTITEASVNPIQMTCLLPVTT